MQEFKIGDRVKIIGGWGHGIPNRHFLKIWSIATIIDVAENGIHDFKALGTCEPDGCHWPFKRGELIQQCVKKEWIAQPRKMFIYEND